MEFRLGRNDHRVVEEFLSRKPSGVRAIIVDASNLRHQQGIVELARATGIGVIVETLTERVAVTDSSPRLPYGLGEPLSADSMTGLVERAVLVEKVIETQHGTASTLVAPHSFVENERDLDLNLSLARLTREHAGAGVPIRAVVAVSAKYIAQASVQRRLADSLNAAGIRELDLRISPVGGPSMGPLAVHRALQVYGAMKASGIRVIAGFAGQLGHTAVALGDADCYSSGIGMRERYDYRAAISVAKRAAKNKSQFGPTAGIFLPAIGITVTKAKAEVLYETKSLRTKLICNLGKCEDYLDGPIRDARGHYLHSLADISDKSQQLPDSW